MTDQVLYSTPDNPAPENRSEGYFETYDGLHLRYGIFRSVGPAKGTVVLLQGRSEFIEKYYETIRDLTTRGLWVATFDLRGQGGSPRLLKGRQHGHVQRFSDYERDLDSFLDTVVLPDTKLPFYLLGHSTGGLIALAAAPYLATRVERMVVSAPFLGLTGQIVSELAIRRVSRLASGIGFGSSALINRTRPMHFASNPLTSDQTRFERNQGIADAYPSVKLGMPTARWLAECFRAMDRVLTAEHLSSITIPTLLIAPTRDGVVPYLAQERAARYFRAAQLVPINGARHEILQERDLYRAQAMAAIHAFIPGSDADAAEETMSLGA
ncbi:alpha/beta hydrolase [Oryzifoliimicrobium ureilyticus]|uniref:alpha/beta hydrolase n=1 Tax=Oryzifoliimicrobium ureilyticus TaxID=3113724 RepID=UPI003076232C